MQAQDRSQPKPGPAPTINIKKPVSFVLPNGLKVLVVENNKLPSDQEQNEIHDVPHNYLLKGDHKRTRAMIDLPPINDKPG